MANDRPSFEELEIQIEELKKQNERLHLNSSQNPQIIENSYRLLFENSVDGFALCQIIFECDLPVDFIYLKVNPAFERITGLNHVIGHKATEIFPGIHEKNGELFHLYGSVASTGEPQKFETYFAPLNIWLSTSVICPEKGYFITIFDDITSRKQAELTSKENGEKFKTLFEYTGSGNVLIDINGVYLAVNQHAAKILGSTPEQIVGKSMFDLLPHETATEYLHKNREKIESGLSAEYEDTFKLSTGTRTFLITDQILKNEQGQGYALLSSSIDITDRKLAEESLRESKKMYRLLVRNLPGTTVFLFDHELRYILVEGSLNPDFGFTTELIEGKTLWEVLSEESAARLAPIYSNALQGIPTENLISEFKDSYYSVNVLPVKNKKGKIIAGMVVSHDITKSKQAEEELNANYSLLRIAGETAKFGGWSMNIADNKVIWSDEVANIHEMPAGYSPVLDEGINFYAPEWQDVIASAATGCAKNGIPFDKEMEMITAKGNRIWVRTIGEAVRDTHGKIYKIQGSFQDISERKRVEGQMRESEERFRILLQNVSSVSVQGYAPDGTTQYWNKASEQLYGYTEEEAVGRNLLDLIIPPEMKEDVKQAIQQMAETGKPIPSSELSLMRRDGSRVAVYSSHAIVQVPGKNSELFCIDIDISDRKSTEAALHESEEIFSQFLEKSPIYVFFKDENIRSLRLSRNFEKMLGKPMQEMLGKSMDELFPTEFAKRMVETDRQILQKGEETNYEEEFNGRFYSTTKFPIQINGKSAFLAGFTIDITDQKLAEAEVLRSKQQYDNLVSKIPVGVYILKTKPDGFFALEYASPRMAKLLGLSVENLLTDNETIFKAIHPEDLDSFIRLNHTGILNKVPFDWKGRVVVKGDIRWLHISSNPEQLDNGEMLWHGLIVDITERMRDEAEIKLKNEELTNLNATKDKFFSIIAHDLKSPFNSIIGFSSLLSRQLQEKDFAAIERYAGIIQNSSLQAMDLLMNLLEWSRSQTGRIVFTPENIDLSVLINQTIELFYGSAQHKSITIYSEIALTRSLSADKAMINTILRNLISNAIKFTKTGGEIIVSAWQMSNDVVVSVSDNGVGMDEESIAKLFRIDQNHSTLGTEKEKGTGLGLLLCSEFVEKHSGRIWVESTPGKGSKFSFTIPETKIPNTLL